MPTEQEVRTVLKRFRKEGWVLESGKGSHVIACKGGRRVSIPTAKREIPIGTYRNIKRAAGWE